MRRFVLEREQDVSGVSGCGIVAEGTQYSNGVVTLAWVGEWPTANVHPKGMESVEAIHGHGGLTKIVWVD